ncbi:MAG: DUF4286 family protein [Bacteroidetes bacterium]|nr:MAG: DUF4286 family protein [Bacteroidota bacterium]
MILYNVTVSIDPEIQSEWLVWMREIHIPEVMSTGCFSDARLSRIQGEESGGLSYSIMYFSPSKDLYEKYQRDFAPALQQEHTERYAGRFAAFRTILDVVEEFRQG